MAYLKFAFEKYRSVIQGRPDVVCVATHHILSEKFTFFGEGESTDKETYGLSERVFDWGLGGKRLLNYKSSTPEVKSFQMSLQAVNQETLRVAFTNVDSGIEAGTTIELGEIVNQEFSVGNVFLEGGYERLKTEVDALVSTVVDGRSDQTSGHPSVGDDDLGPLGPGSGSGMHMDLSQFAQPAVPPEDPAPEG